MYIAPRQFKATVGTCNPMFAGTQQHDAQEYFSYIIDCIHEDLLRLPGEKPRLQPFMDITTNMITKEKDYDYY